MDEQPIVGPRLPRRESGWVAMPDPYEGFEFRFWVNAPQRLWNDVQSDDQEIGKAALTQIVLEHNGWADTEGRPFPPASDAACWEEVPTELLAVVITLCNEEMTALAKSLAPKKRR